MAKQIAPLFDVQVVTSMAKGWTLAGYERVITGVMRKE